MSVVISVSVITFRNNIFKNLKKMEAINAFDNAIKVVKLSLQNKTIVSSFFEHKARLEIFQIFRDSPIVNAWITLIFSISSS